MEATFGVVRTCRSNKSGSLSSLCAKAKGVPLETANVHLEDHIRTSSNELWTDDDNRTGRL